MMKRVVIAVMAVAILLVANQAGSKEHDSRVRLLMHFNHQTASGINLTAHFIPVANLADEESHTPFVYMGATFTPVDWLTFESAIGHNFGTSLWLVSPRIFLNSEYLYFWAMCDLTEGSEIYHFAQIEYRFTKTVHGGFEEESWGDLDNMEDINRGFGPNILLRGKFRGIDWGIDLATHYRWYEDDNDDKEYGWEFVTRVHLFF